MRDPKRIDEVLRLLKIYWDTHPDLRLGQIVVNITQKNDPFYVEDEDFIRKLMMEIINERIFKEK